MEEKVDPNNEIEELLFGLYQELRNILGNINYVNRELPTLGISQALQDRAGKVFEQLEAGVALTKKEVEGLERALRNGANGPESAVLLASLREPLNKGTREMSGLVFTAQSAANSPDGFGLLNFLLTESGANIRNECCHALHSVHRST
jgi:hypothetical protein